MVEIKAEQLGLSPEEMAALETYIFEYFQSIYYGQVIDDSNVTADETVTDGTTDAILNETIERILERFIESLLNNSSQNMPQLLVDRRATRVGFEARLHARWHPAFNLFEATLAMAQEAGREFNEKYRLQAAQEQDYLFEVLTRLQARACLTASEVFALLISGHASGANARWRTLHELAVIAYFIKEHGPNVAERYLLHQVVESANIAEQYQQYETQLGLEPITDEELIVLRTNVDALCQRFGPAYRGHYGWAADALDSSNPKFRPNFTHIEQAVSLEHWRPHYGMASHSIHAKPKGVAFDISNISSKDVLFAGPSNTGFADPGAGALMSLSQITTLLLALHPSINEVVAMRAITHFVEEASQIFVEIQSQIEDEERAEEERSNSL